MNPCPQNSAPLVWLDLEMTGLNYEKDVILEIACLITDGLLNEIAQGPDLVIGCSTPALSTMDPVVQQMHEKSGLLKMVAQSSLTMAQAQDQTLAFVAKYCQPRQAPLCGNSVWMDRLFLKKHMPLLEQFLHYRVLDVSSIKLVVNCWYGGTENGFYKKNKNHRAMEDIRESIGELNFYRETFFKKMNGINS